MSFVNEIRPVKQSAGLPFTLVSQRPENHQNGRDSLRNSPSNVSQFQAPDNNSYFSLNPHSLLGTPVCSQIRSHRIHAFNFPVSPCFSKNEQNFVEQSSFYGSPNANLVNFFLNDNIQAQPLLLPVQPSLKTQNTKPSLPTRLNSDDAHTPSYSESEDSDGEGPAARLKNYKGLKLLSVSVRDIVSERTSTTYKEVADTILMEAMSREGRQETRKSEQMREEQNIKRRVYDALNVLISAGVLIKEGKRVRKNEAFFKTKASYQQSELASLTAKLVTLTEQTPGACGRENDHPTVPQKEAFHRSRTDRQEQG